VEVTHGRIAMLAAVGFLVGEQVEGKARRPVPRYPYRSSLLS